MLEGILATLSDVFTIQTLVFICIGVLAGIVVGSLPGLTATMGVALLVPITFTMTPENGMALLLGMYNGAIYGGSISAILINIPGTPAAIATNMDGYPLAKQGQAGRAIGMATVASFLGGTFSVFVLMGAAPLIANFALRFGPPEYFSLAIFGLSIIATISSDSLVKGLIGGFFGLFLATIGMDPITSFPRYTFDNPQLLTGVELIPVMIGLFGLSEGLAQIVDTSTYKIIRQNIINIVPKVKELKNYAKTLTRSAVIGTIVGAIPAAGAPIAALLAYNEAKRNSKAPEQFGKGCLEGVAAAECANNASTGGALIPLLTLCLPGDGVTAILLGAFMVHNIQPGPLLFRDYPNLVNTIYLSMAIANVCILFFGLGGARFFAKALTTPKYILIPTIILLCVVGSFAVRNNYFDVGVMIFFGVLGYILQVVKIPPGPIILGLILGPMAEAHFRRALMMSDGSPMIFFTSPLSATFLFITLVVLAIPFIRKTLEKRRATSIEA